MKQKTSTYSNIQAEVVGNSHTISSLQRLTVQRKFVQLLLESNFCVKCLHFITALECDSHVLHSVTTAVTFSKSHFEPESSCLGLQLK